MKIAMATDTYFPRITGVASAVRSLKNGLQERGHKVLLIAPEYPADDPLLSIYREEEENILRIPSNRCLVDRESKVMSLKKRFIVNEALDRFGPDILHVQTEFSALSFLKKYSRIRGIPIVSSFRTNFWEYYKVYVPFAKYLNASLSYRLIDMLLKKLLKGIDCVIPLTDSFKEIIESRKIHENLEVIPSGVRSDIFYPDERKRQDLKNDFFRKSPELSGSLILTYVARLSKEKNIPFLFKVLESLRKTGKNVKLVIIGDGPARMQLEKLAHVMGLAENIFFTGYIHKTEIAKYLCASRLFVTPSKSETMGNSVIEAMSCGLPVIGLKSPGIGDILKNDNGGILAGNDEEFANAARVLLSNTALYDQKSKEAFSRSLVFMDSYVTEKFIDVYSKVILKSRYLLQGDSRKLIFYPGPSHEHN